jgi:hypothetical protein
LDDRFEPRAAGLKSRLSLMRQQNRPKQSAASQQGKRTFVAGAAKSLEAMTELRTLRTMDFLTSLTQHLFAGAALVSPHRSPRHRSG